MSPRALRPEKRFAVLAAALALGLAQAPELVADATSPYPPGTGRRIVAMGDIHGAYNGMREILRRVGIIDQRDQWIGGDAILVQTGDFLDRGPGATKVAELLMALQKQAPKHGGEAIVLLGNHEVLNLLGDLRDVTKYILRNFVDGHSDKRLEVSCNAYAAFHKRLYALRREKAPKRRELTDRCFAEHRLGLVEYLEEMSPSGKIGRWLRKLPAVALVDDIVFVHGGISSELTVDLEKVNREIRREIRSFDITREYLIDQKLILPTTGLADVLAVAKRLSEAAAQAPGSASLFPELQHVLDYSQWLTLSEHGPLWFRGYSRWSEEEGSNAISSILQRHQANHVVVGHTPQPPFKIRQRFGAQVFLIDTGMLTSFYKGHPSALEIQDGVFTAFYLTSQSLLYETEATAAAAR